MGNDIFRYDDVIGSVMYKHLQSKDGVDVPLYGVYTKPPVENTEFTYTGYVSDLYQFEGNEVMNQRIRESISEVKKPIFREYIYLNYNRTRMANEIIIQNSSNIPSVGDVYPQIIVKNTYDGSGAREFLFGFTVLEGNTRLFGFGFRQKIGKMRQVHNIYSRTSFSTPIGNYVEFFANNILNIIEENFNTEVTEDNLLSVLDMIETVGKKRRTEVSNYVAEITKETGGKINAWNLFVGITFFSTIEKNVNIKALLDDIAERVLVIPINIQNVLKTLNK
jgi:hypothetical protein